MTKEEFKAKVRNLKAKTRVKLEEACAWVEDNPVAATGIGLIGTKVLWEVGRAQKRRQIDRIEREKSLSVYDPTMGTRWMLRRKMTNHELFEFNQRVEHGQSRGEALAEMNLLK